MIRARTGVRAPSTRPRGGRAAEGGIADADGHHGAVEGMADQVAAQGAEDGGVAAEERRGRARHRAEGFQRQGVEVRHGEADEELVRRQHAEEQGERRMPAIGEAQRHLPQPDDREGDRPGLRERPHPEPAHDAGVDERRRAHGARHEAEGDGKERPELVEPRVEHLLRRADIAHDAAGQQAEGRGVADRDAGREREPHRLRRRLERERTAVFRVQRLRHPPAEPRRHDEGEDQHRDEDVDPRAEGQHRAADGRGDHRHDQEHHHDERHHARHLAPGEAVAHDGGGEHPPAAAPMPWMTRAASSQPKLGASMASTQPAT